MSSPVQGENVHRWQDYGMSGLLQLGAAVVVLVLAFLVYKSAVQGAWWLVSAHATVLVLSLSSALLPRNARFMHSGALLLALYWLAAVLLHGQAYAGEGVALLVSAGVLATLFFGRPAGLAALLLNVLVLAVASRPEGERWVVPAASLLRSGDWLHAWATKVLTLTMLGGAVVVALSKLTERQKEMLDASVHHLRGLEARDQRLTQEAEELRRQNVLMSRRSDVLDAAVSVFRELPPTLQQDPYLESVARLIADKCGFDHVGIFLLDPGGEWAELRAASSAGGQRMLSRRHRLRVGAEGIVGLVTEKGHPHVAPQVGEDPAYYQNPDLSDTQSEIAAAVRYQGRVVGALDVQQTSAGAFSSGDIAAIQALADLVGAMYRNGQLYGQLQQSVAAERRAYAELSAQAWLQRARVTEEIGYRYEKGDVRRLTGPETERNFRGIGRSFEHAWPLSIRGRFAGFVEAHKPLDSGDWTDGEREFIETVVEQLGPALESARLLEDAQSRAALDRLLADVAARTRETLDLDTVLRTAADEIYTALGLREVVIHLVPSSGEHDPRDGQD